MSNYDNVIIENDKQDAQYTYKHSKGYQPGIAFIGRIPVHIENRNGNTPARYEQKEILQRCFDNLNKHHIKIKHFRADAASYQKEVIELAEKSTQYFYIRMMDFEDIREYCGQINNWQSVEINYEKKEVASILYEPFDGDKQYRIVVTRKKRADGQMDLLSGSAYTYQGIITNNYEVTEKEVIEFYNQRGDAENSNRYMLNDFNLHHLPFPDLSTNTVYMYLMAMCATLFEWVKTVLVKNKSYNPHHACKSGLFSLHHGSNNFHKTHPQKNTQNIFCTRVLYAANLKSKFIGNTFKLLLGERGRCVQFLQKDTSSKIITLYYRAFQHAMS